MIYKVSFSANENGETHVLVVSRVDNDVKIIIDGEVIVEDEDIQKSMKKFIEEYATDADTTEAREEKTYVLRQAYDEVVSLLFRGLAANNVFLNYAEENYSRKTDTFEKYIIDAFRKYCYDSIATEWTSSSGKVLYFLGEQNPSTEQALLRLYETGHLHKIEMEIGTTKKSNYYVPFDYPNRGDINTPEARELWREIMKKGTQCVMKRHS